MGYLMVLQQKDNGIGVRIAAHLRGSYPDFSQKNIKKWLSEKKVMLNGRAAGLHDRVFPGDSVSIDKTVLRAALGPDPAVDCRFISRTKDYIFLHKGPCVHSVAHAGTEKGTVANWLLSQEPALAKVGKPLEAGLVHRLDYEASGVMVAARNRQAFEHLKGLFHACLVDKLYVCLTAHPPPLGRHEALAGKHPKSQKRVRVMARTGCATTKGLRPIITEVVSCDKHDAFYRVNIRLITGYRHQIRAHLSFLGCPIVGDKIYGGVPNVRLMLHAQRIEFANREGKKLSAISEIPKDFFLP